MFSKGEDIKVKRPLIVHCYAGVGRTGSFLVLEGLYDKIL